jgi:hypothetical protein
MGLTLRQFEQMKERVAGRQRAPAPVLGTSQSVTDPAHQIILGIDPSLRGTGFGIIQVAKRIPRALAHGSVACPAGWARSRCLVSFAQTLLAIISEHRPTVAVI